MNYDAYNLLKVRRKQKEGERAAVGAQRPQ